MRSQESGVRSEESGVRSEESGVRSQDPTISPLMAMPTTVYLALLTLTVVALAVGALGALSIKLPAGKVEET